MPTEAPRIALRQATRLNFEFITYQRETRLSRLHAGTTQGCPVGWDAGMPAGQTPVLAAPGKRHGLSMISAISNQGLVRFGFIEEAMNTDLFIGFMERLVADSSQKVFLILDNLKVHHAKLVTAWLAERKDQIEVFYLPPYSPEINPDEYLNRDLKTELRSSDRATTQKALLQKASRFMAFLSKTPERVMAYFNHSTVHYAALPGC